MNKLLFLLVVYLCAYTTSKNMNMHVRMFSSCRDNICQLSTSQERQQDQIKRDQHTW